MKRQSRAMLRFAASRTPAARHDSITAFARVAFGASSKLAMCFGATSFSRRAREGPISQMTRPVNAAAAITAIHGCGRDDHGLGIITPPRGLARLLLGRTDAKGDLVGAA